MDTIKYDSINEGILEFSLTLEKIPENIKVGQTFELVLGYLNGIPLVFEITKIDGTTLTFNVEILGKLNNEPLAFEQAIIAIDGKEVFVLPGFLTEPITTEGFKSESDKMSSDESSDIGGGKSSTEESSDTDKLSSDEGNSDIKEEGKDNITLSFRQVSGFDKEKLTFEFFGLTTEDLPADFSFIFMIFLITGEGKGQTPFEAECKIKEAITLGDLLNAQAPFDY